MHNGGSLLKFRFVYRGYRGAPMVPRYIDVLLVEVDKAGAVKAVPGHGDSVVWYRDNLIMGTGGALNVYSLDNLQKSTNLTATHNYEYVIPVTLKYRTAANYNGACVPYSGEPCLTSLSFDRANNALLSSEFHMPGVSSSPQGRLVRWPFNLNTWLPDTDADSDFGTSYSVAAWRSPLWGTQGAVAVGNTFYLNGFCPTGYNNGYRQSACVYQAKSGETPTVVTSVPDMTQNLDWNAFTDRLHGVNEVAQADRSLPQRLVFDFDRTATPISTFRLKNVHSQKCLVPWGAGLNDNLTIVQWDCSGTPAQSWYHWPDPNTGPFIRNFQSKKCLSLRNGSTADNTVIEQFECRGTYANQKWGRGTSTAGGALLTNQAAPGKCATIYNSSTAHDAHAVLWPCYSGGVSHAWVGSGLVLH
ncbi:hypothetical protein B1K54_03790 [Streptomyces sp. fd1-xmd]|nr:hypothetical protein B1K54_03790 [Streptomyces sp. fd1-xmd]